MPARSSDTGASFDEYGRSNRAEGQGAPKVSIVLPCLNEEQSIGEVVKRAWSAIAAMGGQGEVIVVDNGSTDRSREIALSGEARVIYEAERGYGNALRAGINAAAGSIIVIADADGTYDLAEAPALVRTLVDGGYDLVLGSRFRGSIEDGAMSLRSRIGNPFFTWLFNKLFGTRWTDVHSGMRAFRKEAYAAMRMRARGFEFALEMLIKAAKLGLRGTEVPIRYLPSPSRGRRSHLRTLRDGYRSLKISFAYRPETFMLAPAILWLCVGAVIFLCYLGVGLIEPGRRPGMLDVLLAVITSSLMIVGAQAIMTYIVTRVLMTVLGLHRWDDRLERLLAYLSADRLSLLCAAVMIGGLALLSWFIYRFLAEEMGPLHVTGVMAIVTAVVMSVQAFLNVFLCSLMGEAGVAHRRGGNCGPESS
jgi:glycosyltransferase involved in cell wall biosynthesis